eukprot:5688891-Amphidinium_carterae.1
MRDPLPLALHNATLSLLDPHSFIDSLLDYKAATAHHNFCKVLFPQTINEATHCTNSFQQQLPNAAPPTQKGIRH